MGGACVFDEVSVVYLKDANAIQIWLQCAGCLHYTPQLPSSKQLMGTCVLSIFIRLGEQGDGGLSLWGLKSLFAGGRRLSEVTVMPSGSFVAAGPDLPA